MRTSHEAAREARAAYASSVAAYERKKTHKQHQEDRPAHITLSQPTDPEAYPVVWTAEEREYFKVYGTNTASPMTNRTNNKFWWSRTAPGGGLWNSSRLVGNCMDLAWVSNAQTADEFLAYYTTNFKTLADLITLTDAYRDHCVKNGQSLTRTEALNEYLVHLIDESFAGYRSEVAVMDWMNMKGKHAPKQWVRVPDKKWDNNYALDLVLLDEEQDDNFRLAVQVKPKSFWWKSPKFDAVKIREAKKHAAAEAKGKKVWFINKDDLQTFGELRNYTHWSDLVLSDGTPVTEVMK